MFGHAINFTMMKDSSSDANITPFEFKMTSGASDILQVKGQADISKELP